VSDGCRPFGLCVFRNGPLSAASRAPKKPVPDVDLLGECQDASMGGMASGAGNGIVEDIESHDGYAFHSRAVKATRHAPHDAPRASSQTR
jgi:hypothetical protein